MLGTLLMGLTFTLTSFACIGPFVGPLLVASVQTSGLQPVFGMASFATGLAAPFFLLALFPSFLQKMPKSGGWLMRVKVVLGFVVLAIAMKYLSSADQILQTDWISREMFLACLGCALRAARPLSARLSAPGRDQAGGSPGRRPRAGRRAVPDVLHQLAAGTVRRIARQRGGVHSGPSQGHGVARRGRRAGRAGLDEEPISRKRSPRPAPRTSWCSSTSPAMPAPTAIG